MKAAADESKSRLGRGLAALIGDLGDENVAIERARGGPRKMPISLLRSNPRNPRKTFREQDLADLTRSVKEKGLVQPIVVRPLAGKTDSYEIIAGERRWRAAQAAGLHDVPVVVLEVNDREALELAIIENVQRADLDSLEEAAGYQELMDEFSYTQDDLAKVIGKSRSHVANTLRLLGLPESIRALVKSGALSAGHARALLNAPNAEALAERIARDQLSVREAEQLAQESKGQSAPRARAAQVKDADTLALEKKMTDALGLRVVLKINSSGGGRLEIAYNTFEQLDDVCNRLSHL